MARTRKPNTQPIQVASGGEFGDRARLESQQAAAPMRAGAQPPTPSSAPAPSAGRSGGQPIAVPPDVFRSTERPSEPGTLGAAGFGSMIDVDDILRAANQVLPSEYLTRLLNRR